MDNKAWSVEVVPINGPDDLGEPTGGSDVEIVQLKPGKLQGCIKHFGIGNVGISLGQFSSEIRVRGALDSERAFIGTVFDSAGRITHWRKEFWPGDIGVCPAMAEFDAIHGGGATYCGISISVPQLTSILGGEEHLADPAFWNTKRVCNTDPLVRAEVLEGVMGLISSIERRFTAPSDQATDFFVRSIIGCMVEGLRSALPQASAEFHTGARLVSETEDYIDAAGERPVHISELCSALKVSRRSLHRAFADTLGIGPIAYLRRRRLSAIQSVLRRSDPATTSIGELAFEYGFPEPGRFAAYYRAYFDETPSETIRSRSTTRRSLR